MCIVFAFIRTHGVDNQWDSLDGRGVFGLIGMMALWVYTENRLMNDFNMPAEGSTQHS